MIPRSLKLVEYIVFDSMVISQNMVIVNFLFILVTFQAGIMAFLTSIYIFARTPIDPCEQNCSTRHKFNSRRVNNIRK